MQYMLWDGIAPQEAVDAPRLHYQALQDQVYYERSSLSPDALTTLTEWGTRWSSKGLGAP
jgi:gamma-glutamyltranspeptidase